MVTARALGVGVARNAERKHATTHDVVGIGNAIVDIIGRCDDAFLARHSRSKGSMQLVDAAAVGALYDAMDKA